MREIQTQKQIVNDLGLIEQICQSPALTPVQTAQLELKVQRVLQWIDAHHKSVDCDVALQLLDFLRGLNVSKDFQSLFGAYHAAYIIHINAAFFVQQSWRESPAVTENHAHLKEAIAVLRKEETALGGEPEAALLKVKVVFCSVRHHLHLAASYSQFSLHKKALKAGQRCLHRLDHLLNCLQPLLERSSRSAMQQRLLAFIAHQARMNAVLSEALRSFESGDASQAGSDALSRLEGAGLPAGEKVEAEWLQHISIASFMHVEYVSWEKARQPITAEELVQSDFFALLAMTVAALLFVVATENRFVCLESFPLTSFKIRPVFEKTHQQRLRRVKRFLFSERTHAHALRLLQVLFRPNALAAHLAASFQKNYQGQHRLEDIPEVDEGSFATPRNGLFGSGNESGVEYSFDNAKTRVFSRERRRESFGPGPLCSMGRMLSGKAPANIYIFENLHNKNNIYMNCADRGCRKRREAPAEPQTDRGFEGPPHFSPVLACRRSASSNEVEKLLARIKEKKAEKVEKSAPVPAPAVTGITPHLLKLMKSKLPPSVYLKPRETGLDIKKLISSLRTKKPFSAKHLPAPASTAKSQLREHPTDFPPHTQRIFTRTEAKKLGLDIQTAKKPEQLGHLRRAVPPLDLKNLPQFSSARGGFRRSISQLSLNSHIAQPPTDRAKVYSQTSRSAFGIQKLLKQLKTKNRF